MLDGAEKHPHRFVIEELRREEDESVRVVARCDHIETARAVLKWAREQYPSARLIIRDGEQIIADTAPREKQSASKSLPSPCV